MSEKVFKTCKAEPTDQNDEVVKMNISGPGPKDRNEREEEIKLKIDFPDEGRTLSFNEREANILMDALVRHLWGKFLGPMVKHRD